MTSEQPISSEFPFESKYVEVHGSKMHYIDEGEGDPILFLHGNPTSSYLWRNIIPYVTPMARAIAPDLIGMGRSDKPKIPYRFFDHSKYLEGFIEALDLKNLTLVIHDWGSGLGFHYACRHEANVKGIAFMEAIVQPSRWSEFPPDYKIGFKLFRTPGVGWMMISVGNVFLKKLLPKATARPLTAKEMAHYLEPFPTIASRLPVRQWPREIPIDGHPADVQAAVQSYADWLGKTQLPKLLFYARPGGLIPRPLAEKLLRRLPNIEGIDIGKGIHYVQEDNPHGIGSGLVDWYAKLAT